MEPEFGKETPLDRITAEGIDQYRLRLLSEGELSRGTIQKRMVVLGSVLKRAVRLKWIRHNPLEEIERVNVPRTSEFNVLSPVQVEAVARKATSDLFKAAIIVGAYTGLRAGELRALRWRDVNFAGESLRVARSLPVGGELGPPKSGHARSVPLMPDAFRALDRLSLRGWGTEQDAFVFCEGPGQRLGEDRLRKALYAAMKAAGIDRKAFPAKQGFTLHDLRHTFGTLAVQVDGWTLPDVQAFMGHADIETTMIYVHHTPKNDAAQRFGEFVQQQRDGLSGIRLGDGTDSAPVPVGANGRGSRDYQRARQDSNL